MRCEGKERISIGCLKPSRQCSNLENISWRIPLHLHKTTFAVASFWVILAMVEGACSSVSGRYEVHMNHDFPLLSASCLFIYLNYWISPTGAVYFFDWAFASIPWFSINQLPSLPFLKNRSLLSASHSVHRSSEMRLCPWSLFTTLSLGICYCPSESHSGRFSYWTSHSPG